MLKDYFMFSIKNLAKRKLRSWLTMIGIFIGIAAVVSLIGLGEGLRIAVTSQFNFLGSDVLSVQASGLNLAGPPGTAVATPLTDDLKDKILKINGVDAAINRYIESGTLEFNDRQTIGMAMSIPEGSERKILEDMLNLKAEQGRLLKDGDNKKVLLGNSFKEDDIFGKGIKPNDRVLINDISFEVIGILEKKGSFLFDSAIAVNEQTMLNLIREADDTDVNVIGVKVKNVDNIDNVKENIEKLMRKERNVKKGEEDFVVESPQNLLATLNSTLFAVQLFIYIIASISIVVGGIGIMNTMYTAVLERTKEIGIMKAIGAKNSVIFFLFSVESGFLGMVGGIIGIIFGLLLAYGLAFIGQITLGSDLIQAHITFGLIIGALLFSFILGIISGIVPAYQASKMQPVEALSFIK
ncbi:MAG: ABC transporter permease [Candidatus Woesearchaeota archaeon]|jgi:putative ABC transport system permease protein|nr:ABC transporter permease [Candidatus Woesearchaeota archaeon]MDP7622839.1 ABC transporter permease [Candidatus Woesearchaeota archaeon]HJN56901.1 ABC transporter permease [Candidatus Woesearchaeota archaeon]|tara:strand:+ start:42725 stop:43954 length:1230 start_codon:yes stop_codon:yes gene_type:complete